jgi:hypothetical protein
MAETLTPNLALPYYTGSDQPAGMDQQKALALKLDGISSLRPPPVTSLPGSPVDGQEIYYIADATNGVVWQFRYRSASPSTYKWEFVGGAPLVAVGGGGSTSSTTYQTTGTPSLTLTLAGDYEIDTGCAFQTQSPSNNMSARLFDDGAQVTPPHEIVFIGIDAFEGGSTQLANVIKAIGAGSVMNLRYATLNAGLTMSAINMYIRARPVRVG